MVVNVVNKILIQMDKYVQPENKKRKKIFGVAAKIVSIYIKTFCGNTEKKC